MSDQQRKVEQDRKLLNDAQAKGTGATLGAYVRLSGPGWLQSAITLGGGSLAGALFLGALGGVSMLWLQLMAITMGVIMLSAISYVTLSTGERPFDAINRHINPALGWGWLIATSMANMIWCMPQFSLCYTSLNNNLLPDAWEDSRSAQVTVSLIILAIVSFVVFLNARRGAAAKVFDLLLKGLVGMIVLCFFGVVVVLTLQGQLDWGAIFAGFIPDPSQLFNPSGEIGALVAGLPEAGQAFWSSEIVPMQRDQMIAATATAVGINMTFLMPYSMLHRGWDKTFRGLARFDLMTGMAIPYVVVTSCVVIAAAFAFNAKADANFLSTEPATFQTSPLFKETSGTLWKRVATESEAGTPYGDLSASEQAAAVARMAALPEAEKRIAASTVKRNAAALAGTLAPLIGEKNANRVFGLGVFGMGFSTIIILMLINGFVFCEAVGKPDHKMFYAAGCLVAGVIGAMWPFVWGGTSQFWFTVVASTFGAMLLPIAYVTFYMMMNSRSLMGAEKPTGGRMLAWNVLMGVSTLGATVWAVTSIFNKATNTSSPETALAGKVIIGMVVVYLALVVIGFFVKPKSDATAGTDVR